ncbi:MAG: septum formation protein [Limisphaerales bacterium]|jgi:septum formation protein
MKLPSLILASASPRRAELLGYLGVDFTVIPSAAEETADGHLTPEEICLLNAYRKARAVAKEHPDRLVLGADTIVCLGTTVFGKPASLAAARRTLNALQGVAHSVITGMCLIQWDSHRERVFCETTQVSFRELSAGQINRYLAAIDPLDKAGAYAIQDHGEMIVEQVSGSFTNVVGLPLGRLREELESWSAK